MRLYECDTGMSLLHQDPDLGRDPDTPGYDTVWLRAAMGRHGHRPGHRLQSSLPGERGVRGWNYTFAGVVGVSRHTKARPCKGATVKILMDRAAA